MPSRARLIGPGAWFAALIYATLPAVLLNTRRAMYEGALLFTLSLVLLLAVSLARRLEREGVRALAALAGAGYRRRVGHRRETHGDHLFPPALAALTWIGRRKLTRTLAGVDCGRAGSGRALLRAQPGLVECAAADAGRGVAPARDLLELQTAAFGGFTGVGERAQALWSAPLGPPQYYEVTEGWPQWIGGQIADYEAAGLAGIAGAACESSVWRSPGRVGG